MNKAQQLNLTVSHEIFETPIKKLKKKSIEKKYYCKNCGILITNETRYKRTLCNKEKCIRSKVIVCALDCLNCGYYDCIVASNLL